MAGIAFVWGQILGDVGGGGEQYNIEFIKHIKLNLVLETQAYRWEQINK